MDKKESLAQIFLIPAYPSVITALCFFIRTHLIGRSQSARGQTQAGTEACTSPNTLLSWTLTQDSSAPAAEQTERAFQEIPIACLPCQQLPPAQAEPLEPWDVPALACTTVTASCSSPSLLLLAQPWGAAACALTVFQHPSFQREGLPFI